MNNAFLEIEIFSMTVLVINFNLQINSKHVLDRSHLYTLQRVYFIEKCKHSTIILLKD